MREDFIQERAEYRDSLAGMREAMQAADADCRQAARERDEVLAKVTAARAAAKPRAITDGRKPGSGRSESKTARFLALVAERYGELSGIDPVKVGSIAADLAPEVGLNEAPPGPPCARASSLPGAVRHDDPDPDGGRVPRRRGTAAGCKWRVARLGWLSFLAVAGVAAFLVWRHGVWPLIPPAVRVAGSGVRLVGVRSAFPAGP